MDSAKPKISFDEFIKELSALQKDWQQSLRNQLPHLPLSDDRKSELMDAMNIDFSLAIKALRDTGSPSGERTAIENWEHQVGIYRKAYEASVKLTAAWRNAAQDLKDEIKATRQAVQKLPGMEEEIKGLNTWIDKGKDVISQEIRRHNDEMQQFYKDICLIQFLKLQDREQARNTALHTLFAVKGALFIADEVQKLEADTKLFYERKSAPINRSAAELRNMLLKVKEEGEEGHKNMER